MSKKGYFLNANQHIVDITKFTVPQKNLLGGTLDKLADHWKGEIDKVGDNVGGFFEKLGEDIKHFPEDIKKAVKDLENELFRFGMEFNPLMKDMVDKSVALLESIPTPEEFGKQLAVHYAQVYKSKEDNPQELCVSSVGAILVTLASLMNIGSGGAPNPYADYLLTYYMLAAEHGCTEA